MQSSIEGDSAFRGLTLLSNWVESGSETLAVNNDFRIDFVHHKLLRNFASLSNPKIPAQTETLGSNCFPDCESFA
jgi:hypothetical protein